MNAIKRRQLFVDRSVQGMLMLRTLVYWALCLTTIGLMLLVWQIITGPPRPFAEHVDALWRQFAPAAVAAIFLLPIVVIDTIRVSNRIAGPMVRLRRAMRRLAEGESVGPVYFRDHDPWQQFADDFNRLAARVQTGKTDRDIRRAFEKEWV